METEKVNPEPTRGGCLSWLINSNAVGMVVARSYGFEIDFVRNPFSG